MCFADTFSTWPLLGWIKPVCEELEAWKTWINSIVMVLALAICCAYTGFLISALIRFPLINTAVLPALFVASGISAGMAATKILAAWFFGAKETDPDMHAMHQAEWPVMATEAFCLFMIAIALLRAATNLPSWHSVLPLLKASGLLYSGSVRCVSVSACHYWLPLWPDLNRNPRCHSILPVFAPSAA